MRKAFCSSVFLVHEGKVLLVLHKRFNKWLPIGGELENGESPIECAIRETKEETGIEIKQDDFIPMGAYTLRGLVLYEEHDAGDKGLHMNFNFVVYPDSDNNKLCSEHSDCRWVSILEYMMTDGENITPSTPSVHHCMLQIAGMEGVV